MSSVMRLPVITKPAVVKGDRLGSVLSDSAAPWALLLLAWQPWLDDAVAQGKALPHFMAMRPMLAELAFEPLAGRLARPPARAFVLALPPSLPAISSGWPANEPVRIGYACLGDATSCEDAQRIARRCFGSLPGLRARTLLTPRRTPELAALPDLLARDRPPVRCHSADEIESALPRARQLAKALARTPNTDSARGPAIEVVPAKKRPDLAANREIKRGCLT
jgi:hypothetical protein